MVQDILTGDQEAVWKKLKEPYVPEFVGITLNWSEASDVLRADSAGIAGEAYFHKPSKKIYLHDGNCWLKMT